MDERDKTIAELKRRKGHGEISFEDFCLLIWNAARADAIEECAQFAKKRGMWPQAVEEMRSLSRKQEEPR